MPDLLIYSCSIVTTEAKVIVIIIIIKMRVMFKDLL